MNTATHTPTTARFNEWHDRVRGSTHRLHPMAAKQIARMCFEKEAAGAGENCSVWHNTALFHGTACHCQPCERAALAKAGAA